MRATVNASDMWRRDLACAGAFAYARADPMSIRTRNLLRLVVTTIGVAAAWYLLVPRDDAPPEGAPGAVTVAPPFDLALTAIRFALPPEPARATLVTTSGEQGDFTVGGNVFGRATITAIRADHVELDRDGARYTLWLPATAVAAPASDRPDRISVRGADALEQFGTLDYQPVRDGPTFRGMRVAAAMSGGGEPARSGLRSGDLITSVNDVPLTDEIQFVAAIRDLASTGRVTFGVKRDNMPLSVTIEVTK